MSDRVHTNQLTIDNRKGYWKFIIIVNSLWNPWCMGWESTGYLSVIKRREDTVVNFWKCHRSCDSTRTYFSMDTITLSGPLEVNTRSLSTDHGLVFTEACRGEYHCPCEVDESWYSPQKVLIRFLSFDYLIPVGIHLLWTNETGSFFVDVG